MKHTSPELVPCMKVHNSLNYLYYDQNEIVLNSFNVGTTLFNVMFVTNGLKAKIKYSHMLIYIFAHYLILFQVNWENAIKKLYYQTK